MGYGCWLFLSCLAVFLFLQPGTDQLADFLVQLHLRLLRCHQNSQRRKHAAVVYRFCGKRLELNREKSPCVSPVIQIIFPSSSQYGILRDLEFSPANGTIPQNPRNSHEKRLVRTNKKHEAVLP